MSDAGFVMIANPIEAIDVPGEMSSVTIGDANYTRYTPATVHNEYLLSLQAAVQGALDVAPAFQSTDEAVATVDASGVVTVVSYGQCAIIARTRLWSQRVELDTTQRTGQTVDIWDSWVEGTPAYIVSQAVDSRIAGKTPAVAKPIFTTQNHATGEYVRNPNCWAADLDLTGISPWNSRSANKRAGTLIAPDVMICAMHYGFVAGDIVRFVKADGTVVDMTIRSGGVQNITGTDIQVCIFTESVPAGIAFYKVLPADAMTSMFPRISSNETGVNLPRDKHVLPVLAMDQEEKALVTDIEQMDWMVYCKYPADATRLSFNEPIIVGDSGNPAFLIFGDELLAVTTWWGGGGGSGPAFHHYITEINAAMTAGGSANSLTILSLE